MRQHRGLLQVVTEQPKLRTDRNHRESKVRARRIFIVGNVSPPRWVRRRIKHVCPCTRAHFDHAWRTFRQRADSHNPELEVFNNEDKEFDQVGVQGEARHHLQAFLRWEYPPWHTLFLRKRPTSARPMPLCGHIWVSGRQEPNCAQHSTRRQHQIDRIQHSCTPSTVPQICPTAAAEIV